jgi:very-short-patch-repair endonuclease
MEREGFAVVRVAVSEVSRNLEGVLAMIAKVGVARVRDVEEG